jgi:prepilin-type N-terminal cleavage/methylation domain-containing protein
MVEYNNRHWFSKQKCSYLKFTLIELLVVLSIVAVLAALVAPAFSRSRKRAKYTRWLAYTNNLRSDSKLIGQWNFVNKNKNLILNDAQGLDEPGYNSKLCNAEIHNIAISETNGRWNKRAAYFFGQASTYLKVNDGDTFYAQNQNMTIIVWFNTNNYRRSILIQKGDRVNRQPGWKIALRGRKVFFFYNSEKGRLKYRFRSESTYALNKWNMVAMVIDNENHIVTGYLNTEKSFQARNPTNDSERALVKAEMYIGRKKRNGQYYRGFIDEIEIFRRALSEKEIKAFYEMGSE